MLDSREWAHLIPHDGCMRLLDTVLDWDLQSIHACSDGHRDSTHPLRRNGHLHALHLIEYGAQAAAVHGALRARLDGATAPRPGMLVALRDVHLALEFIDDLAGTLHVHARCLYADDNGSQYLFHVEHAGVALAQGRCTVIHRNTATPVANDTDAPRQP